MGGQTKDAKLGQKVLNGAHLKVLESKLENKVDYTVTPTDIQQG